MLHLYSRTSATLALVFFTLMAATTANALMLDCTTTLGAEVLPDSECTPADAAVTKAPDYVVKAPDYVVNDTFPAAPIDAAFPVFQIDPTRSSGSLSNSVLLLLLISVLLAFLLVRAKRFNTK